MHLLEGEGFRCREAGTGVEALRVMESDAAPLVISDLRMPEMDGVSLLRHLTDRWPDTAVIMVSAVADVEIAVKCLQLGALDYVSKPFNLDEVRARVDQALTAAPLKLELKSYQEQLEDAGAAPRRAASRSCSSGGVQALAQALEAKDAYLRGHSLRVSEYAVAIARQLGMDAGTVDTIPLGGHLHDIGKIGVSEEVLHKAGRLTDGEYRHIMEHPVIGARILGPLLRDAPLVIAIVRSHHERIDGKGLPDGLKGDAIPLVVRIVSVADAFDAMTSERPYRPSLPVERALRRAAGRTAASSGTPRRWTASSRPSPTSAASRSRRPSRSPTSGAPARPSVDGAVALPVTLRPCTTLDGRRFRHPRNRRQGPDPRDRGALRRGLRRLGADRRRAAPARSSWAATRARRARCSRRRRAAGLVSVGCDVIDIGLTTTPSAQLAVEHHRAGGRHHPHREPQPHRVERAQVRGARRRFHRRDGRGAGAGARGGRAASPAPTTARWAA